MTSSVMQIPQQKRDRVKRTLRFACINQEVFVRLPAVEQTCLIDSIENACYSAAIRQCADASISNPIESYSSIVFMVASNIDPCGSIGHTTLFARILNGEFDLSRLHEMNSRDLVPELSQDERTMIELRKTQKVELKVSTRFRCGKCGENKTIPIEYQGRSSDEPSTFSIKCITCGNIWRRSG